MPSVLVTGASRGIGRPFAVRLAERGWEVYAGVRRQGDADALGADQSRISPINDAVLARVAGIKRR